MPKGAAVDRHHWIPRKYKGTEWSWVHRICHKKIHSLYDERTLARELNTPAALLAREEMQRFVGWVRKQPLEKIGRHHRPSRR